MVGPAGRRVTVGTTVICAGFRDGAEARHRPTITGMGPGGPVPLQLLDRAAELAAIVAAIDSACAGSGSALLLEGVAGIGDAWVVDRLRQAAADARGRGAPDVAIQCLERALAEPPPAGARGDVLFELGSTQTFHAPAAAAEHLAEALARTEAWPRRGEIALALSQALGLCGRFAEAAEVLQAAIGTSGDDRSPITISLQAALLNVARWDLDTRPSMWPVLERQKARAAAGEELDPQLHANLAIELGAAGLDRERAARHARAAVRATSQLMSLTSTARSWRRAGRPTGRSRRPFSSPNEPWRII